MVVLKISMYLSGCVCVSSKLCIAPHQVNLYMTHYGNYAQDRLATYMFDRAFAWVRNWTRLSLRWAPVHELVQYHMAFNPTANQTPLHSNPCDNPRHAAIWPQSACTPEGQTLPSVVIVGPQKTGQSPWRQASRTCCGS